MVVGHSIFYWKLVQAVLDLARRLPPYDMDTFMRYSEIADLVFGPQFVPKLAARVSGHLILRSMSVTKQ